MCVRKIESPRNFLFQLTMVAKSYSRKSYETKLKIEKLYFLFFNEIWGLPHKK